MSEIAVIWLLDPTTLTCYLTYVAGYEIGDHKNV